MTPLADEAAKPAYQVLARKYRPETFADLYGQDAMVRTLKNAFDADRIAHAFIMTGIRGTGKTTTARIIAKGLNCIGPDGQGGPTIAPCGVCDQCVAISEGRHVDVMEMDAASRTGVGDIREIIESVHYRAASARYKVYIIDEVHMLSNSAFNALLKTLEEPPEHVKFIFATTEIRKVPVTVLSRCQRFDLRRIEPEVMVTFLKSIASQESADITDDALALITRAAEGSARDALSLLDQAISHGAGHTGVDQVRTMLGLADRGRILDLFELIMRGDAAGALTEVSRQYADGADPAAILRDLAEVTHWISVVKISPEAVDDPTVNPDERDRGRQLANNLPMRALTRAWQMLLKIAEEVNIAPNAMMATEMGIIRLTHISDLPTPGDLVRKLQDAPPVSRSPSTDNRPSSPTGGQSGPSGQGSSVDRGSGAVSVAPAEHPENQALMRFATFQDVVELIRVRRDIRLLVEVENFVRLVKYRPGSIEFEPAENAPVQLASQLSSRLQNWTGVRWVVSVVSAGGQRTIAEERAEKIDSLHAMAATHPLVLQVMSVFPGAEISEVRGHDDVQSAYLPEVDEDPDLMDDQWDPIDPFDV